MDWQGNTHNPEENMGSLHAQLPRAQTRVGTQLHAAYHCSDCSTRPAPSTALNARMRQHPHDDATAHVLDCKHPVLDYAATVMRFVVVCSPASAGRWRRAHIHTFVIPQHTATERHPCTPGLTQHTTACHSTAQYSRPRPSAAQRTSLQGPIDMCVTAGWLCGAPLLTASLTAPTCASRIPATATAAAAGRAAALSKHHGTAPKTPTATTAQRGLSVRVWIVGTTLSHSPLPSLACTSAMPARRPPMATPLTHSLPQLGQCAGQGLKSTSTRRCCITP